MTDEIATSARKTRRAARAVVAQRMHEARHRPADLVELQPRRRRRWLWLVLLLGIAGAAGAAARARGPQQIEPERFPLRPASEPSSQHNDQDVPPSSPAGNGVVRAGRPSPSTD